MINQKITFPRDDNFSDDELAFLPYFTYFYTLKVMEYMQTHNSTHTFTHAHMHTCTHTHVPTHSLVLVFSYTDAESEPLFTGRESVRYSKDQFGENLEVSQSGEEQCLECYVLLLFRWVGWKAVGVVILCRFHV